MKIELETIIVKKMVEVNEPESVVSIKLSRHEASLLKSVFAHIGGSSANADLTRKIYYTMDKLDIKHELIPSNGSLIID